MDDFGIVSVLLGIVNVGVVFSLLGHETLATREIAATGRPGVVGSDNAVAAYIQASTRQVWMVGLAVCAATLLIALQWFSVGQQSREFIPLLILIPLVARTRLAQAIIRGEHRPGHALVPDGIVRPGLAMTGISALLYTGNDSGYLFSTTMIFCAAVALAVSRSWVTVPLISRNGLASNESVYKMRNFSFPIYISSLMTVLVTQIAVILTGMLSTPANAGLYAAAERFSLAGALVGQAVFLAVASRFSAMYANGEASELRALIRTVTRSVAAVTTLVCVMLFLAGEPLLSLYGEPFRDALPAFHVLLVSVLFNACAGPTGVILLMTGHEKEQLTSLFSSLLVLLLLIAVLVPRYGVLGAASAQLVSTVVWNSMMLFFVRRRLDINPLLAWA